MSTDDRLTLEELKHVLFPYKMQIKQLRNEQLSRYYKLWILSAESLMLGFGSVIIILGSYTAYTDGIPAAIDSVTPILNLAFAALLILTVFLRIVWTTLTIRRPQEPETDPGESQT